MGEQRSLASIAHKQSIISNPGDDNFDINLCHCCNRPFPISIPIQVHIKSNKYQLQHSLKLAGRKNCRCGLS